MDGKEYCVLHSPQREKLSEFLDVYENRIKAEKTDFRYVYFPNDIFFTSHYLSQDVEQKKIFNTELNFNNAVFCEEVNFFATFKNKVSFDYAVFKKKVSFSSSTFKADVSFLYVEFTDKLYFVSTKIGENSNIKFSNAIFKESAKFWIQNSIINGIIHLDHTVIEGFVIFQSIENHGMFEGDNSRLNLRYAQTQGNGRLIFDKAILYPNWFIDTDARKFIFVNPNWKNVNCKPSVNNVYSELEILRKRRFLNPQPVFKITCRHLAENAENNNRFEEASNFRRMAFETEYLERKDKIINWWNKNYSCSEVVPNFGDWLKAIPYDFAHFAYRFSSFYGESSVRAFIVLFAIIVFAAFLYFIPLSQFPVANKETFRSLDFLESIFYSLRVMVLQRPEPFPSNTFGKAVLALESVIAPVQLALLALAIRRKFMR